MPSPGGGGGASSSPPSSSPPSSSWRITALRQGESSSTKKVFSGVFSLLKVVLPLCQVPVRGAGDGPVLEPGAAAAPRHLPPPRHPLPSPRRHGHQHHGHGLHEGGADDVHGEPDGGPGGGGERAAQADRSHRPLHDGTHK